jgi:cobalt/nickel transport system permease protein
VHIAEGILPAEWALAWAVPAAVGTAAGLHQVAKRVKEDPSFTSLAGLMGAAVFAISLMPIPVPVAGSVSHPAGTPLAAIVVGPMAGILLAAVSLLIQALFFAHGGLTTLGANIVSEGMVGSLMGFGVFWVMRRGGRSLFWAGFAAGLIGDLAVYLTTATELGLGLFPAGQVVQRSAVIFLAFMPTQLPLALLEGVLTGGILRSLAELRPDVAARLHLVASSAQSLGAAPAALYAPAAAARVVRPPLHHRVRSWWRAAAARTKLVVVAALGAVAAAAVWAVVWAVAVSAGGWVGLDAGVMNRVAAEQGRKAWRPFINTDVGDLLLYVFFFGAFVAGGAMGWIVRGLRIAAAAPGVGELRAVVPLSASAEVGRAPGSRRRGRRVVAGAIAGVLLVLALWAWAAPGVSVGPVSGADVSAAFGVVAHPSHQKVLSSRGGDVVLFVFMIAGLTLGMLTGWRVRGRSSRPLRLRLPHFHLHDVRTQDRLTWQPRRLQRVDARLKLAVVVVLLVVNLLTGWAVSLVLLVTATALLLLWQRVRLPALLIRLVPAVMVASMLVLLRGFTVPGRSILSQHLPGLATVSFTVEGVAAGAELGLVVLAGVMLMLVLGLTTPLPALLKALRWYRVPALLVEIGMLMYRYLFLFVEEAGRMRQAQRLRGPRVSWSRAMGGFSRLGANLLIRSFDRSQRVYDAQRLRGGS